MKHDKSIICVFTAAAGSAESSDIAVRAVFSELDDDDRKCGCLPGGKSR